MKPKQRLTQVILFLLSGVSLASVILIGALWIGYERAASLKESREFSEEFVRGWENDISSEITRIAVRIAEDTDVNEINFLRGMKDRVEELYGVVSSMEKELGGTLDDRVARLTLASFLRNSSFKGGKERVVCIRLSDGFILSGMEPLPREREYFQNILESVTTIGEGFYRFNFRSLGDLSGEEGYGDGDGDVYERRSPVIWNGTNEYDPNDSISYLKVFPELGWVIGVTEFIGASLKEEEEAVLSWVEGVSVMDNMNIVVLDFEGNVLTGGRGILKENVFLGDTELSFTRAAARIIKGAIERSSDFENFVMVDPETGEESQALGYYRAVTNKPWVVAGWVMTTILNQELEDRSRELSSSVNRNILRIAVISVTMLAIILVISRFLSKKAAKSFSSFYSFFDKASYTSVLLVPAEQSFEEFARLAEAANRMIVARNKTEKLLTENELKFRTIFEVSPQAVMVMDRNFRLIEANDNFEILTGIPGSEAKGMAMDTLFRIDSKAFAGSQAPGKRIGPYAEEIPFERKDGQKVYFLFFGTLLSLDNVDYILGIFVDMTERKSAEAERERLTEKLSRAQTMETMGLMASEVAHELNNILSGIIGYPELLLREGNLSPAQSSAMGEILDAGKRAAAVVEDLLTLASGVATSKVPLELNESVKNAIDEETGFALSPEEAGSPPQRPLLRVNLSESPLWTEASPLHLKKSIRNLLANAATAAKLNPEGGVVTLRTERETLASPVRGFDMTVGGSYAVVTVKDNGRGISPEDKERVFEPFYTGKLWGGRGLGLTLVANTARALGGAVDFTSSEKGSVFKIYLPEIAKSGKAAKASKKPKKDLSRYYGKGERILVVDDVDIQRKLASKMLKSLGYDPVTASSGEEAAEYLKANDVDLLILDMIMNPGINGRETYQRVLEFKPDQKAIIASGMADGEEVDKARALGAAMFVHKPYSIEVLAEAVFQALYGTPQG
jgi:PAS domain S-box-containing protein